VPLMRRLLGFLCTRGCVLVLFQGHVCRHMPLAGLQLLCAAGVVAAERRMVIPCQPGSVQWGTHQPCHADLEIHHHSLQLQAMCQQLCYIMREPGMFLVS
jgi:hypothetical protein